MKWRKTCRDGSTVGHWYRAYMSALNAEDREIHCKWNRLIKANQTEIGKHE